MKKLLLLSLSLVLVGAGCLGSGGDKTSEVVEGDWVLTFDLPNDWVMVSAYKDGEEIKPDHAIEKMDTEIVLQSTSTSVLIGGRVPDSDSEDAFEYVSEDFSYISVLHLDPRRIVPSESEDLGDGFSKLDPCVESEDCGGASAPSMKYYLETETGKYQFNVHVRGEKLDTVEKVIMSAVETTN